jgi:hypothetical protein
MKGVWNTLLRWYPRAHRESFGTEMEAVFDQAAEEHRTRGWLSFAGFLIAEVLGLLKGIGCAWIAESRRGPISVGMPDEAASTQTLIAANLRRMEHAIATHQFEKARFYSHYDLQLRERLSRLQKA